MEKEDVADLASLVGEEEMYEGSAELLVTSTQGEIFRVIVRVAELPRGPKNRTRAFSG